ncbi:MAG: DNA replication/repair protein RecF [Bdellovibrionota bacterium]
MILEQIRLYHFRCYDRVEIHPDPRFNVVTGLNGQGKTSLLEAIGLLAFLRSFRHAKNAEMLRVHETEGLVEGRIQTRGLDVKLAVKLWPHRKQATFNGKTCKYLSEYVGKVSAVSFSPSDLEIVRGSPENRRIWIDKVAQIFDPSHADAILRYHKLLEHRNRQLRAVSEGRISTLSDDFEVWTEELVLWGSKVIHNRIHSVDKIVDKIRKYYDEIAHKNVDLNVRYLSEIFDEVHYGQANLYSLELISRVLTESLKAALPKERIVGSTLVGPHRDDVELTMAGNPMRSFGSQGEVRSLVLAMRLTEVEAYKTEQGLSPILLIDDFSSELDARRREFLLQYLLSSDSQVFLSTTEDLHLGKIFLVNEGRIGHDGDRHLTDGCQQL